MNNTTELTTEYNFEDVITSAEELKRLREAQARNEEAVLRVVASLTNAGFFVAHDITAKYLKKRAAQIVVDHGDEALTEDVVAWLKACK